MRGLELLVGLRVVADPGVLDRATWSGGGQVTVIRIAPDEAFAIGATAVEVGDTDAIVEPEAGFMAVTLDDAGLDRILAHVEFHLPSERPALVQGKVAGVPARLLLEDERTLLIVQAAYRDDLEARLR